MYQKQIWIILSELLVEPSDAYPAALRILLKALKGNKYKCRNKSLKSAVKKNPPDFLQRNSKTLKRH